MGNDKIIETLGKARDIEERSIPLYTKHLASAVFWTGLREKDVLRVKAVLNRLAEESAMHKKIVENLLEMLKKESGNAF